jgi:hypothetical protein
MRYAELGRSCTWRQFAVCNPVVRGYTYEPGQEQQTRP